MLVQFSQHIYANFPFVKDKNVLLAISGGLDSVVLAHLMVQLDYNVILAHCNFQLRGEDADLDETFVKDLAKQLQIPVYTKKFDTKIVAKQEKLSIQLAARMLRYKWFNILVKDNNLDYIFTAHHADDNLETFIINLSRGTGLDGLTGIPVKNNNIIRPLLPFHRSQIEQYAKDQNLSWREDTSNAQTNYLRNKIRHQVIPSLKEVNPDFLDAFNSTIHHLKETKQMVDDAVEMVKQKVLISDQKDPYKLSIIELKKLKHPKAYLYEILKKYNFTEWNDVNNLLDAQSGKQIFSGTHRLLKDRNFLILSKIPFQKENLEFHIDEAQPIFEGDDFKLIFSEPTRINVSNHSNIITADKNKIKWPLVLRKWKNGDYFYPFGMQGKKKLSKFFKDEKLSLLQKEALWVLCSEDTIVWVVNYRLDDRYKVTEHSKTILKIEYKHH